MAKYCDVSACVDCEQLEAEFHGRPDLERCLERVKSFQFKTPLDFLKLFWTVVKFKPSVVHFQEAVGPRRGFFVACIAVLVSPFALIVLTVHDPLPHQGRDVAAAGRTAWVASYVRRLADVVIVHGAYCARTYQESIGACKQLVVQSDHGLVLEPQSIEPYPAAPLKLYFFGRMEVYKGVEVLLLMAESLHDEGLPFELSISGRGPELDRLQERFERLPEVRVHNGFVPPLQVMASIQAADCVLLPYLSATQSGVLAAAFAGRRYVIASEAGGIPDVVEHGRNGLLVSPGDPQALADAVRKIAHDPALRVRLREGAEATATGKLDWNRIAEELFKVFERATVNGRGGSRTGSDNL